MIAIPQCLDFADAQLMTALYSIGQSAGSLRALTNYLQLAGLQARARNEPITLALILSAQQQMG